MKWGYLLVVAAVAGAVLLVWRMKWFAPTQKVYPVPPPAGDPPGKPDTTNYSPVRKVVLDGEGGMVDLELPYIQKISTDTATVFKVLGDYKGKLIGFELTMPVMGMARATFESIGEPSDNFLQVLSALYKLKKDAGAKFARVEMADCLAMGDYVDSLRKNGVYAATAQNKLFFESQDSVWEAECYLNVDTAGRWIQFNEKEDSYRKALIRDLSERDGLGK